MSRRFRLRRPHVERSSAVPVMRAADPVAASARRLVPGESFNRAVESESRGGQPLAAPTRRFFEQRLGEDLSQVRLHDGPRADVLARSANARAFTLGNHIYFADGERHESSPQGRHLIAHELVHVAQQGARGQMIQRQPRPQTPAVPAVFRAFTTLLRVVEIMCRNSEMQRAFEMIARDGIRIVTFETAFDTWKYDTGQIREEEVTGLRGNTDHPGGTIRLNQALSAEDMAETLYHELQHWSHRQDPTGPRGLESEIQARIATERLAIERGRPPTRPGYRTADGRVDEAAIRRDITGSQHYNPTNREWVSRRYVGETVIPADLFVCPPIGDFPTPSREVMVA
jgi:Domain of unknown function (DUF4157)